MTTLDLIITAVVVFGAIRGFFTGVLSQLAGTVGVVIAFWLGLLFMEPVGSVVVYSLSLSERLEPYLGFVVTFTLVVVGVYVVTRLVQRTLEGLKLSVLNKAAGALFGGLRWALALSVVLLATSALALPGGDPILISDRARQTSTLYAPVAALAPAAWELFQSVAPAVQAELQEKFRPSDS